MPTVGMDPEQVDDLARRLASGADLLDHLRTSLGTQLRHAAWTGMDADNARHDWETIHVRTLLHGAEAFRAAAGRLHSNSTSQREASEAGATEAAENPLGEILHLLHAGVTLTEAGGMATTARWLAELGLLDRVRSLEDLGVNLGRVADDYELLAGKAGKFLGWAGVGLSAGITVNDLMGAIHEGTEHAWDKVAADVFETGVGTAGILLAPVFPPAPLIAAGIGVAMSYPPIHDFVGHQLGETARSYIDTAIDPFAHPMETLQVLSNPVIGVPTVGIGLAHKGIEGLGKFTGLW